MESLWQDVKFGARMLLRSPGFTAVAMLSLALGIGANTAIFTVTNAIFLSPLPVEQPSRLMLVQMSDRFTKSANGSNLTGISPLNYFDIRDQNDVFSNLAAFMFAGATLSRRGDPRPVSTQLVSPNYFETLGVKPALGRIFLPGEGVRDGADPIVVLSYSMWTNRFGADPALIGQSITLNLSSFTVVGVMPQGFKGTALVGDPDIIWMPMSMHSQVLSGTTEAEFRNRRLRVLAVFGRLRKDTAMERADAALKTIAARLEKEYPFANDGRSLVVSPLTAATLGPLGRRGQLGTAAIALSAVVGLVLLIACFNLVNMLLARASRRSRELGIRAALGAERGRLVRQLLTESLMLAAGGGAGGLVIALWGRELLWSFRPSFLTANAVDLRLDLRVLLFTAGVTLVTGLIFGLAPALRGSSGSTIEVLKSGGRANTTSMSAGFRGLLVVSQVALTVIALAGAGLFIRSLHNAQQVDFGFESHKLFLFGMDLGTQHWPVERGIEFQRAALERVRELPGVESAALSSVPLLSGGFMRTTMKQGQESETNPHGHIMMSNYVSPEYFETVRVPLRDGRTFTEFDRAGTTPVVVINEAVANAFWPGESVIGRRLYFFSTPVMRTVVGVVRNTITVAVGESPQPIVYLPLAQAYQPSVTLEVRTAGDPAAVLATALADVQKMNSTLVLGNPRTIEQLIGQGLWAPRMGAALFGIFGGLGLLLAAIGIYGVMAYMVAQRTNEIGIRMALGARPGDVLRMIVGQSLRMAIAGIVLGVCGALALARLAGSLLFDVSTADPLTYAVVCLILTAAAALAGWAPAWRASRIDPVDALR